MLPFADMDDDERKAAARAMARSEGCTCSPDVTFGPATAVEIAAGAQVDALYVSVEHDDWCALLRAGDVN